MKGPSENQQRPPQTEIPEIRFAIPSSGLVERQANQYTLEAVAAAQAALIAIQHGRKED